MSQSIENAYINYVVPACTLKDGMPFSWCVGDFSLYNKNEAN